jgi:glucosamine--fructose-6-phosphate aminotransferase (isomerizing)
MCGIFGYIGNRRDAAGIVLEGLKTLEYRGYDSWGIAALSVAGDRDTVAVKKRVGKIGEATDDGLPPSTLAMGHTRWATHGGVTGENAHPHCDCSGTIALIHNGIIENYGQLRRGLTGHRFVSETDSEIAVHMIEDALRTMPLPEAVRTVFRTLEGCNALVVIASGTRQIVAVKTGSPLVVGYGDGCMLVASDAPAILPYTRTVHFLEDGEMAVLTDSDIAVLDVETAARRTVKPVTLSWSSQAAARDGYATFMEKEIRQQPQTIRTAADRPAADFGPLIRAIRTTRGLTFTGCGTAYYACMAATYLFADIAKRHTDAVLASESGVRLPLIGPGTLAVALSQSGETMDLIDAVKAMKTSGAAVAALVNVMGSTLYRRADIPLLTLAGPEIAVASTKDMTAKLAHLVRLAYGLSGNDTEGIGLLTAAAVAVAAVLTPESVSRIAVIAESMAPARSVFVLGRGAYYPLALETALKIKEISYVHAEGLPAGELKHGPLALVESGTPCIVLMPDDGMYGANLAAAMEMKARGGRIIAVTDKPHEIMDDVLPVGGTGFARIFPTLATGQMLGLAAALSRGLDPDKPRNLAKSVTVK